MILGGHVQLSAGPEEVGDVRLLRLESQMVVNCVTRDTGAGNTLGSSVRADKALEC